MDLVQVVLVIAAVAIGFFAKGVTGIGGPLLAVPVLAAFMGVEYAVVVIAIPTFLANCWLLWDLRGAAVGVAWFLWPMVIAGAVGTAVGAWVLVSVDDRIMSLVLAALILAYIPWYLLNREFSLDEKWARRLSAPAGFAGGWLAGATGVASPAIATYVHALDLGRSAFIFAVTLPFWVLGVVQIVSYTALGSYDQERVVAALIAVIPVFLVLPMAARLGERLSQRTFQMVVLVVLAAAAIRLVWSAL